jgi:hypothetical protein
MQNQLPPGTKELLGLNLKFCLAPRTIKNNINNTILQMARSIRTRYYLAKNNLLGDSEYEKQIYKRNLNWHPLPAPLIIEEKLTEFEKSLKSLQQKNFNKHKHQQLSNLTPLQSAALQKLRENKNIIIEATD